MSQIPQTNFIIPSNLVKGLLDYLRARPYSEVASGVQQLEQLEPYGHEVATLQEKLEETRQQLAESETALANLRETQAEGLLAN